MGSFVLERSSKTCRICREIEVGCRRDVFDEYSSIYLKQVEIGSDLRLWEQ